jgi:hypothetical protein
MQRNTARQGTGGALRLATAAGVYVSGLTATGNRVRLFVPGAAARSRLKLLPRLACLAADPNCFYGCLLWVLLLGVERLGLF